MKELTLEAKSENLDKAVDFIKEGLAVYDCSASILKQLEIAIEEIFVNIAMYAYGSSTGKVIIRSEIQEEPRCIVITFIDEGVPYNPLEKSDPDTTVPIKERKIGGYGIFLVKKKMDEMSYKYEDGKNILTTKKNF